MEVNEKILPANLITEIGSQCERAIEGDISVLVEELKSIFGGSLVSIILYGSCLRNRNIQEGVVDLYIVVNNYNNAYKEKYLRVFNSLLPPNVFYIEVDEQDKLIRAKYAVISLADLNHGVNNWFHSYIWSRFAQPVRILYCCDRETKIRLYYLFSKSVILFLKNTIPGLGQGNFDTESIWINGLTLSYTAELRPENKNRAKYITHQSMGDFIRITQYAAPAITEYLRELPRGYYQTTSTIMQTKRNLSQWRLRRWQGRILSILRLTKAVFTFKDCVNYAAWKINRHTGINIKVTPVLQRHPILFGFNILWRLIKRDALH